MQLQHLRTSTCGSHINNIMKITVYGLAATGTSTVSTLLAQQLKYEYRSSGELARQEAANLGMTIYEFDTYSANKPEFDIARDDKIATYGATKDNFVFDSRLAWHFIPDSFKIHLVAEAEETFKRVAARENCSISKARKITENRRKVMEARFQKIYPDVLFPPPNNIFDITIDTTHSVPEEIVAQIISVIK